MKEKTEMSAGEKHNTPSVKLQKFAAFQSSGRNINTDYTDYPLQGEELSADKKARVSRTLKTF